MDVRTLVSSLCLVAAGCRDPNPYFVEPPLTTTTTGGATIGETTAPTGSVDTGTTTATTATTTITGGTGSASAETGLTTDPLVTTTSATTGGLCSPGEVVCEGTTAKVCDGDGGFLMEEPCGNLCVAGLGCADCEPGTGQCLGDLAQTCAVDGTWTDVETCDPIQGTSCELGACIGACSKLLLGRSNLGCDFYAATLASLHYNEPAWTGVFAVVVVNATDTLATITVTLGAETITTEEVAAGAATVIKLGYLDSLVQPDPGDTGPSLVVSDGAYRVRTDQPVTVYAFEPLTAQDSGDASVLLPVHAWGTRHVVASHHHWVNFMDASLPGWYAVIADQDGTQVTLTPSATGGKVAAGGGVDASGAGVVVLDAGQVLEVFSDPNFMADETDLTGTIVAADRPISVLSGHKCAEIPDESFYCDRLEESMPPTTALGYDYLIAPSHNQLDEVADQIVRVIATEDDTTLTFDPFVPVENYLAEAGDWIDLTGVAEVRITADHKLLVAQYMTGGNQTAIDPSMIIAVPTAQFRQQYRVFTSGGYADAGLTVIAPALAAITIDGIPVSGGTPIGASGYTAIHAMLPGVNDASVLLDGDMPFGVAVHGYDDNTSYWLPGGLELVDIP